ncbi:MAG TPA: hypothetical protein VHS97_17570 [Isosphaeraceae bacterium]|nr:hypothetical protein [Isosphaeraceae bacterium]
MMTTSGITKTVDEKEAVVRTLMSGPAYVHYGQIYVESGLEFPDMTECFGGQRNGLCGAAVPGLLFLITGLHTGDVGFTVELYDKRPPVDEGWQEIVETSFRPMGEAALVGWGCQWRQPLDLAEASYRVRYCAAGMDDGSKLDTRMAGEPEADRYLLLFWPAPLELDAVIKQTSGTAAYWHEFASQQQAPPAAATS